MIYTEFTGKTVEEAVEKGLKELGIERENADIRVLEEGKKKLFFLLLLIHGYVTILLDFKEKRTVYEKIVVTRCYSLDGWYVGHCSME